MPATPLTTGVRVHLQPHYDATAARWHWTLVQNDRHQSICIARSVQNFPMERDAMAAGRHVLRQLKDQ